LKITRTRCKKELDFADCIPTTRKVSPHQYGVGIDPVNCDTFVKFAGRTYVVSDHIGCNQGTASKLKAI